LFMETKTHFLSELLEIFLELILAASTDSIYFSLHQVATLADLLSSLKMNSITSIRYSVHTERKELKREVTNSTEVLWLALI